MFLKFMVLIVLLIDSAGSRKMGAFMRYAFALSSKWGRVFLPAVLFCFLGGSHAFANTKAQPQEGEASWKEYVNDKYGYAFRYPDELEFRLTGPENERDGRHFSLALRDRAMLNGVQVNVYPGKSLEELARICGVALNDPAETSGEQAAVLNAKSVVETGANGQRVLRRDVFTKSNEALLSTNYVFDNVCFQFFPYQTFDTGLMERILSTFRFHGTAAFPPEITQN